MRVIIFLLFFTACATIKGMHTINFVYYEGTKRQKLVMNMPDDSKLVRITAGGEGEEHRYWYADSSVIYVSNLRGAGTLNDSLINKRQDYYNKKFSSDTASFIGIDEKGHYWKEVKNGKILYGYTNVPSQQKEIFDKALSTVKYK